MKIYTLHTTTFIGTEMVDFELIGAFRTMKKAKGTAYWSTTHCFPENRLQRDCWVKNSGEDSYYQTIRDENSLTNYVICELPVI